MAKVMDKKLGVDYSYMLNRQTINARVITDAEILSEENDLIQLFLAANKDLEPYIDKALFDPTALVARKVIDWCKNPEYMVGVNGKEYRLPQVIMMMVMGDCYRYVTEVAKALAEQTKNHTSIQLSDEDVYTIAENYTKKAEAPEDDLPTEIETDDIKPEPSKQISFFDL